MRRSVFKPLFCFCGYLFFYLFGSPCASYSQTLDSQFQVNSTGRNEINQSTDYLHEPLPDQVKLDQSTQKSFNKLQFGLRFIAQATTFRYRTNIASVPALLDYLKISSPYYFRVRTAQGIGVLYHPLPRISLGADLMYSLQGGGYQKRKTNLDYLTLPLWVGFGSRTHSKVAFSMQSGVVFSYLLRAQNKYADGESSSIRSDVNPIGWGIPLALGTTIPIRAEKPRAYQLTVQLYLYSDFSTVSRSNPEFGVYNYVYPGLRIAIDQVVGKP